MINKLYLNITTRNELWFMVYIFLLGNKKSEEVPHITKARKTDIHDKTLQWQAPGTHRPPNLNSGPKQIWTLCTQTLKV